jgi:hypothetical protein
MRFAIVASFVIAACAVDDPELDDTTAELVGCFEQEAAFANLPLTLHVAEPFIRIVGGTTFLYFSDYAPNELRDLHHAVWIVDRFYYLGQVKGVNTPPALEAAPSIDTQGNLYYTNSATPGMISRGTLVNPSELGSVAPVLGMPQLVQSGATLQGNMDYGVAPNHPFGILSRAVWVPPSPLPITADLWYLRRIGPGTVQHVPAETAYFLGALNTSSNLEYAPEISSDGLAIVFTRFFAGTTTTAIMLATRTRVDRPFGPPIALVISTPNTIIEGPTFGANRIFYHKSFFSGAPTRLYSSALCP